MKWRSTAAGLGFAAVMAGPGLAVAQSEAYQTGVQAVLACQDVKGDKAQLACFRHAAKLLAEHPAAGPAPEGSTAQAVQAPAPVPFGAPPPRAPRDRSAEARSAELVVRSMGDLGDGRAILNLADGSSWVETEAEPITSAVKRGDKVRLEKGALGGYLLVLPHRSAIRIRRLRTE